VSGTFGGMAGILAGHPLDTAKTRLQAMSRFEGSSTWRVLAETARVEGPAALYRGLSFPFFSTALLNATVFCVQGTIERQMESIFGAEAKRTNGFLGGCIAGLVQSPLVCLVDLAKTQRQVQFAEAGAVRGLQGPAAVMRERVARLGVRQGCFQGAVSCAIKECPSYGVYFLVYEESKRVMDSYRWHTVLATLSAGGLAGCVALGMIHPVDVIKSRIQALPIDATKEEKAITRVASDGLRREGASFFLRGFGAAMGRAFVINAATFGGVEFTLSKLNQYW